jgi:hypothetical protein
MASLTEYWRKHYTSKKKYVLGQGHILQAGHCVLCLNTGILKSADLEEIEVHGKKELAHPVVPCFCPNGRALRRPSARRRRDRAQEPQSA